MVETVMKTAVMKAVVEGFVVMAIAGKKVLVVTGAQAGAMALPVVWVVAVAEVVAVAVVLAVALALTLAVEWMAEKLSSPRTV